MSNQARRKSHEHDRVVRDLPPHLLDMRPIIYAHTQDLVRTRDDGRELKIGGAIARASRIVGKFRLRSRRNHGANISKPRAKIRAGLADANAVHEAIAQFAIAFEAD